MISQPLQHLDSMLAESPDACCQPGRLAERFLARLGPDARLPCLNELPSGVTLRRETVVKFRGMVQATLEPELYHKAAGHFRYRPADFGNDAADAVPDGGWSSVLGERQRCLCVPVPHETPWLRADLTARDRLDEAELARLCAGLSVLGDAAEAKKARMDDCDGGGVSRWDGAAVELLIYAEECDLRVHDMVEVVAVLSSSGDGRDSGDAEPDRQPAAASPLRLHALSHRRLADQVPPAPRSCQDVDADDSQWSFLRTALLGVFADLLLGDALAAEYLLLHLASAVYLRGVGDCGGGLAVGKLSLNLSCCRAQLARHLGRLLDLLVPRLCRVPLGLRFLNSGQLTPRLDCDTCRLQPGLLQMPAHTQLLLDETALEAGHLDEGGLANLRAVGQLVRDQTVQFDLQMYRKDFDTDLRVLVVSEGKSVLPCDLPVPLEPRHFISEAAAEADFVRLLEKVTPDAPFLREARRYLAGVGQLAASPDAYTVDAAAQLWIEEDFVRWRQSARAAAAAALDASADVAAAGPAADGVTAEDLGLRLVLCRLLALSLGRTRPTRETWDRVGRMEEERKRRCLRASKNAA